MVCAAKPAGKLSGLPNLGHGVDYESDDVKSLHEGVHFFEAL
jgi:hypothetical protein